MNEKTHIFSVPLPYPSLPFSIILTKGDTKDKLHQLLDQFLEKEEIKKLNLFDENGKVRNQVFFNSAVVNKSDTIYADEFSKFLVEHEQEIIKKLFENIRNGKTYAVVNGGLGDMENCDAIVENRYGQLTKFFGNSFLFKGFPLKGLTEGMAMGKSLLSTIPRQILLDSLILKIAILFMAVFRREKLFRYIHIIAHTIYTTFILKNDPKGERYTPLTKALKSAIDYSIGYVMEDEGISTKDDILDGNFSINSKAEKKRLLWRIIACAAEFFYFFISFDTAYRFRLQDVLGNVSGVNARKSVISETKRLLKIALDREKGIADKIDGFGKILIFLLRISPRLRRFMLLVYTHIQPDKIRLDKDDWYFCLRRQGYDFGGKSLEERLEEARRIDLDNKNFSLQLIQVKDEKGRIIPAIKVIQP